MWSNLCIFCPRKHNLETRSNYAYFESSFGFSRKWQREEYILNAWLKSSSSTTSFLSVFYIDCSCYSASLSIFLPLLSQKLLQKPRKLELNNPPSPVEGTLWDFCPVVGLARLWEEPDGPGSRITHPTQREAPGGYWEMQFSYQYLTAFPVKNHFWKFQSNIIPNLRAHITSRSWSQDLNWGL